jgi:hypothetical protein
MNGGDGLTGQSPWAAWMSVVAAPRGLDPDDDLALTGDRAPPSSCQRSVGPPHRHRVVHRSDAVDYRQGSYAGDQQPGVGFVGVTGDQVGEGLL